MNSYTDFYKHKKKIAFISEDNKKISYSKLNLEIEKVKKKIKKNSLIFILASNNIEASKILLKNNETEDLGWLVIRRSLVLFDQKDLARASLMSLISNL